MPFKLYHDAMSVGLYVSHYFRTTAIMLCRVVISKRTVFTKKYLNVVCRRAFKLILMCEILMGTRSPMKHFLHHEGWIQCVKLSPLPAEVVRTKRVLVSWCAINMALVWRNCRIFLYTR